MSLSIAQLVVIGTCAVLAAISAAAIPSAGLVTMVMVMQVNLYCEYCASMPSVMYCFYVLEMSAVCCLVCVCQQLNASVHTLWMHSTDSQTETTVMYIFPVCTDEQQV